MDGDELLTFTDLTSKRRIFYRKHIYGIVETTSTTACTLQTAAGAWTVLGSPDAIQAILNPPPDPE